MHRLGFALLVLAAAACEKNNKPPPPSSGAPGAQTESGPGNRPGGGGGAGGPGAAEAQQMFGQVCATCHGPDGTGNGPAAASLNPKPRNYTDPAWQASISDEQIKQIIVRGGQAMGKSPMMPGNAELRAKPEVLDGLVAIIRGFGKK